ncbi:LysR family transcriptional regulator [Methylobacterium sp. Leaf99]|uniref:LysR substrate-binding domain-containing protein n=1 Tax=Methylobacterium sp. Leaf99 TaxID=1736251 RepID=UPI0006FC29E5|nr:LysR substrate-binding domain-containing protein [Methylobacterium sp. Leaf99]KQP05816.1 LysR family transcriptional regulator [Methylobacterium sp. Leaf99]
MRRLPPLHALRVFEVAARAGSHVAAAAELGLTHGAVSRQVAVLEAWFGQRLFVRVGRSVVPTPAARAFAEAVSLTFDRLDAAAEICGRPLAPRTLRVSTPTTFAMRWLIPRLDGFHAARPEAEVVVTTTTTLHNALRGGFDLAVRREPRLGTGAHHPWGAYRAVPFLREANTLVASPSLLAARPLCTPHDLEGATLLTSETRPGDWTDWLAAAGLPPDTGSRRTFDHYFVALQATADGLGYGLGPLPVLSGDLATGRLVAPFPEIVVPRPGYVALVPNDADKTSTLAAFVDWLMAEGAR